MILLICSKQPLGAYEPDYATDDCLHINLIQLQFHHKSLVKSFDSPIQKATPSSVGIKGVEV